MKRPSRLHRRAGRVQAPSPVRAKRLSLPLPRRELSRPPSDTLAPASSAAVLHGRSRRFLFCGGFLFQEIANKAKRRIVQPVCFHCIQICWDGVLPELARVTDAFSNVFLVNLPGFLSPAEQEKCVSAVRERSPVRRL